MATPTYTELSDLANSVSFMNRCTLAVTKYARFILNEDPATVNHQRRYDWARGAIQNTGGTFSGLKHAIAIDGIFANQNPLNLDTTTDANIQIAVEATINSTVLTF